MTSVLAESLLVGDLHLTELPRDGYRWRIFPAIDSFVARNAVRDVVFLGDLTTAKDRHLSQLVNKIVDHVVALSQRFTVHIVRGNHDGIDPDWPFFGFLNHLPRVQFYRRPSPMKGRSSVFCLPHASDPMKEWDFSLGLYECLLMHQTFRGAIGENDAEIPASEMPSNIKRFRGDIFSGDVHSPQQLGRICYVGAPHPVRFGDDFNPRMIYLDARGQQVSMPIKTLHRRMLDVRSAVAIERECKRGDQIKVRLHLREHELQDWIKRRKEIVSVCRRIGVELVKVEIIRQRNERPTIKLHRTAKRKSPEQILSSYVADQRIPEKVASVGAKLIPNPGRKELG